MIQSLSIVVPGIACINNCRACVSKQHGDLGVVNQLEDNLPFYDLYLNDYVKRIEFCLAKGVTTIMLTGSVEPQQNMTFLRDFGIIKRLIPAKGYTTEMQTTGVGLTDEKLRFLRNHVGVDTIAVSLWSFDDGKDMECRGSKSMRDIKMLCERIKKYDFNLRLCLNMSDYFEDTYPTVLFGRAAELGANQVTIRKLYASRGSGTIQANWIKEHCSDGTVGKLRAFCDGADDVIRYTEYGNKVYSVGSMAVVIDGDCMNKGQCDSIRDKIDAWADDVPVRDEKYYILQPNGKLYSQWDNLNSLIF